MFRVQDNVPEVYINESRDFQILARLSDVLFSGMKYDIDSMVNILDAALARDTMLELMCTKIGFFPRIHIDANVLKYIIASFPYIIKYKGTRRGVEWAVNAILKAENNPDAIGRPIITITGAEVTDGSGSQVPYTVYIYSTIQIYNKAALKEVLRYVLPAGYNYQLLSYYDINEGNAYQALFEQQDELRVIRTPAIKTSALRTSDTTISLADDSLKNGRLQAFANSVVNAYDTTQLVTSDIYNAVGGVDNIKNVVVDGVAEILPTYKVSLKVGDDIVDVVDVVKYSNFTVPSGLQYNGVERWYAANTEIEDAVTDAFFDETGTSKQPITGNIILVGLSTQEIDKLFSGGDE